MKRYLVSIAVEVNEKTSKTGVKYQFWGRTDCPEKFIRENKKYFDNGFRIKDSKTGEIIYQS